MTLNNSPFENIEEPTETTPPTKKMALFNGKPIDENNNPFAGMSKVLNNIGSFNSTETTPPTKKMALFNENPFAGMDKALNNTGSFSNNINMNFIKNQNQLLQNEIIHNKEFYSTDDQKNYYLNENLIFYKKINFYLLIIYFMFAFIIVIITLLSMKYNIYVKIGYIIFFLFFPFFIFRIEIYIYNLIRFIYSLINGEVYKRKSFISE